MTIVGRVRRHDVFESDSFTLSLGGFSGIFVTTFSGGPKWKEVCKSLQYATPLKYDFDISFCIFLLLQLYDEGGFE